MASDMIARALAMKANKTLPAVSSADAGKLATVDSNGKWAAAELDVGQGEVAVDSTLLVSGAAADAKVTGDKITDLKSALNSTVGEVMADATHSYAGGAENWNLITNVSAGTYAIKIYNNANVSYEVAVEVVRWQVIKTITDNKWNIVEVPSGVTNNNLVLTYRGDSAITTSVVVVKIDESKNLEGDITNLERSITNLEGIVNETKLSYGNYYGTATSYDFNKNFSACPCKKADASGKVISLRIKNYASGTVEICVGEVDQLYLFVPRTSFTINVDEGEKVYDVSDRNIFINEGEQILIKFSGGKTAFASVIGEPEGDSSFYYSSYGDMQLQVYGAPKAAVFGFGYTVASSIINEQGAQIDDNTKSIDTLTENVNVLQSNFNVVMDRQGNKYKMIVQNGAIALLAMNFHHVLCVGNSYTTHPTTTDTESDYRNNLWWGHWSMAASAKQTAWTTLLQTALRQKVNDAVVTPVFGRRYETSYNTYTLNNPGTFTYWDGTAWQSLSDNLSDFSDVDGIVFFLGANYSGNDWYTLYSAMVEKFLTWFPNATLFCCSCAASSMQAKDKAIQQVANEQLGTYISMVGIRGPAKLGAYVYGDDNNLHQIDNSAVANHFGDYGEYVILDRICSAMGYTNNTALYDITITSASGVTFTVVSTKTVSGAVVSIFADVEFGTTLSSITVTDANSNNITVTDHGGTSYGRVFTFVMPSANVTVTGNVS